MPRPRRLLSSVSAFSRRAADLQSDIPNSTLPEPLNVLLPACSKACLRAFIADNYSLSSSTDINTLCTTNTASGFTLGEAALICESSYCGVDGQIDKSIFSICASVSQAIRPSHDSLTVVPMATSQLTPGSNAFSSALPPTIGAPATTGVDATMFTTATGVPSIPPASNPAPPPSSPTTSTSTTSSSPETSSASPSASTPSTSSTTTRPGESDPIITSGSSPTVSPATSQAQGNLNMGQIVGVSLAALAILGFAVGLLLFLCYRRRQSSRNRRGSRWSDATEKEPPSFSPGEHHIETGFSNPRAATPDHSQRFYAPPTTTQEKQRSFWRKSIKAEDIGVAVSPEVVQAGSPTSMSSQRTTSQLLPGLPHCSLWPAPLRKSQQNLVTPEHRRELARSNITFPSTFVERKRADKPPRVVSSRTGNGLPTDPRAQMYKLEQAKSANSKIPLTPVYDNGNIPTTFGAILAPRENGFLHPGYSPQPQPQRNHDPNLQSHTVNQAPIAAQKSKLLPPPPPPPPPAHFQTIRARQAPPMRRNSSASDSTNIEDDEDTTPEQENDKQLRPTPLSPVIESPRHFPSSPIERLTTPLKDLTYPSPPRSAAISKQAEKQARPRVVQFVDASGTGSPSRNLTSAAPSSRRERLVPDERSFLAVASSSSSSASRERGESPSSLLAKRKGDKAANQMLQRGLRLSSTAANANLRAPRAVDKGQVSSTQKDEGRGRNGSDTENSMNMNTVLKTPPPKSGGGLKSPPVWTPRLTPTRRGKDLFLQVE